MFWNMSFKKWSPDFESGDHYKFAGKKTSEISPVDFSSPSELREYMLGHNFNTFNFLFCYLTSSHQMNNPNRQFR